MAKSVEGSHFSAGTWGESLLEWISLFTVLLPFFSYSSLFLYLEEIPFSDLPCSLTLLFLTVSLPSLVSCPCSEGFPASAFAFSSLVCLCQASWALPCVLIFLSLFSGSNIRTCFPSLAMALPALSSPLWAGEVGKWGVRIPSVCTRIRTWASLLLRREGGYYYLYTWGLFCFVLF